MKSKIAAVVIGVVLLAGATPFVLSTASNCIIPKNSEYVSMYGSFAADIASSNPDHLFRLDNLTADEKEFLRKNLQGYRYLVLKSPFSADTRKASIPIIISETPTSNAIQRLFHLKEARYLIGYLNKPARSISEREYTSLDKSDFVSLNQYLNK